MRAAGTKNSQSGMGMIEVLVTLVILLVGLLGLAGLMTQAQRSEMESYQRAQALVLLQDMVGRINTNRKAWGVNGYQNVVVGTGEADPCPGATIATRDICDWHDAITGAAEVAGGANAGAMIGGRGCVSYDAATERTNSSGQTVTTTLHSVDDVTDTTFITAVNAPIPNSGTYTVSVAWQGLGDTFAPSAGGPDCGEGEYGPETRRRIVSETVRFATLTVQ
ncbi:MAG: type IV pilus modification protein PilV [Nitrosomonadales bacterium]|nr:type IV pilus modification protein PilV [Nitrosomonadales bacterium]